MGTSTSSKGARTNVPLDFAEGETQLAPSRRFLPTRRHLGAFCRTGDAQEMQAGIASYVVKGYKSPQIAAQRLKNVVVTAAKLFSLLVDEHSDHTETDLQLSDLEGNSAEEIINRIIEIVSPTDGKLDSESNQDAMHTVLSELVASRPDVDLTNLERESTKFVVEKFVSEATFNRIKLDVGQHVIDHAQSAKEGLSRLGEMKDYVNESFKHAFESRTAITAATSFEQVTSILKEVIANTFEIFQSYRQ